MSDANEPAFPVQVQSGPDGKLRGVQTGNYSGWEIGLTKRELFAAMAMQGLLACPDIIASNAEIVGNSVDFADALIAVLGKDEAKAPQKRPPSTTYIEAIRTEWGEAATGESYEDFLEKKLAEAQAGISFWSYCMDQGMQKTCPESVEELCSFLMSFKVAPYSVSAR